MKKTIARLLISIVLAVSLVAIFATVSWARSARAYSFPGGNKDGLIPSSGLTYDGVASFYGTTSIGGRVTNNCQYGCGTVFKFSRDEDGVWKESVIYEFTGGTDGVNPLGNLALDSQGNLFGATGPYYSGTIFELSPNTDGTWKQATVHTFGQTGDGAGPIGGMIFGSDGSLYGVTQYGGACNQYCSGVVFKLSSIGGSWSESVIYSFQGGADGYVPNAVTLGPDGNLYGTTSRGGSGLFCQGCGTIFQLVDNHDGVGYITFYTASQTALMGRAP
jgi:uncharacterized repeat protein (TIGR03803 family)